MPEMSTEPKVVAGLKVIEVEPGAPLPAEVPPGATRYDVVEQPHIPAERRPWVIAAGALGTLGSAATLTFTNDWIWVLVLSLVALWSGLRPDSTEVLTPAADGRYLLVGDGDPQPSAAPSPVVRVALMVVAAFFTLTGIVLLASGAWEGIFIFAGAWGFFRLAKTGRLDESELPPASARFHELADPSRPLTASDPLAATPERPALQRPNPAPAPD
jgi:hypothetical protein